jgi:hypothetical protein
VGKAHPPKFMSPLTLTDFRFEIPDSRMRKTLVSSIVLESGMLWNLELKFDTIRGPVQKTDR